MGLTTNESVLKAKRAPVDGEHRAVVEWFEELVAELGQHHLLDQLVGQLAAAAVGEHDLLMVHDRHRAGA